MSAARILVADPLSPAGLDILRAGGAEVLDVSAQGRAALEAEIGEATALLVRSRTQVDAALLALAPKLKVVGRAGVGVDNVDVFEATRRGVLVLNAPNANLISATEHSLALLLALARQVPSADASMKRGEWDRGRFLGVELQGKTLGVIGFGRIGQKVAVRAQAFEMKVVAYDPWLDKDIAARLNVPLLGIEALLEESDAVTFHVPLTPETKNLVSAERIARMKKGALLVNCARGGVVDEAALLAALESGHLGGVALDVFAQEPPADPRLVAHPKVVATPHIGAQTVEAQERVSSEVARMVLDALAGSYAVSAVNLPFSADASGAGPFLLLGEQLGRLGNALAGGRVESLEVDLRGVPEAFGRAVSLAVAKGALDRALGDTVNYINVEWQARDRGIEVVRTLHPRRGETGEQVGLRIKGAEGEFSIGGMLYADGQPRLIRLGTLPLECRLEGHLLLLRTWDKPGVIGKVGTKLGDLGVNIADIHLARKDGELDAWTVYRVDQRLTPEMIAELAALSEVRRVFELDLSRG